MRDLQFTKDHTCIVKGIAVIMMILHHLLIKEYYVNPPEFLRTWTCVHIYSVMKCCVAIFTFIVGYGFYYKNQKNIQYFKKHVWHMLKNYWVLLFAIFIPIASCVGNNLDLKKIAGNMIGLNHEYCLSNWYVFFYMYALAVMPLIVLLLRKHMYVRMVILMLTCGIVSYFIPVQNDYFHVKDCLYYTPVLALGYVFAEKSLFPILLSYVKSKGIWWLFFAFVLICRFFVGGIYGISTDIVVAPCIIATVILMSEGKHSPVLLKSLGTNSLLIWFLHAAFFSYDTKMAFQNNDFWPQNLVGVFLLITISSYSVALLLNWILKITHFNKI